MGNRRGQLWLAGAPRWGDPQDGYKRGVSECRSAVDGVRVRACRVNCP